MSFTDSIPIYSSFKKKSEAKEMISYAKRNHRNAIRSLESKKEESSQLVDDLFDLKVNCSTNVIEQAIDVLEKCQKVNRKDTKVAKDSIEDFNKQALPTLKARSLSVSGMASDGVKGTAAGAALSLGAMGTISTLGAASTGTAISALSGAAASNATLAWFGGGAISAGGAGMAGGVIVLGGIALAPVLVIAAFKFASNAEKELTEAREFRNKVKETIAEIDAAIKVADSMNEHVKLFEQTLLMVRQRLILVSERLGALLSDKNATDKAINIAKYELILFIKAIKRLLEVDLFDSNQNATLSSTRIMEHIVNTDSAASLKLAEKIEMGYVITPPENVKYLSKIPPGVGSSRFFWLLGAYEEFQPVPRKKTKSSKPTQPLNFGISNISFKHAFILTLCSAIAFGYSAIAGLQETPFMVFSGLTLFTFPPLWVSYKSKIKILKILAWLWFSFYALFGLMVIF